MSSLSPQDVDGLHLDLELRKTLGASRVPLAISICSHSRPAGERFFGDDRYGKSSRALAALDEIFVEEIREFVGRYPDLRHSQSRVQGLRSTACQQSEGARSEGGR